MTLPPASSCQTPDSSLSLVSVCLSIQSLCCKLPLSALSAYIGWLGNPNPGSTVVGPPAHPLLHVCERTAGRVRETHAPSNVGTQSGEAVSPSSTGLRTPPYSLTSSPPPTFAHSPQTFRASPQFLAPDLPTYLHLC